MTCREARNAMLLPEAGPSLAAHLASCPDCAEVARQSAKLDAGWAATRPNEPNFDAIWAGVEARLDAPATLMFALGNKTKPFWKRPRLLMSLGFVQAAAAALIAAWVLLPTTLEKDNLFTATIAQAPTAQLPARIEVDADQVVVFGDVPQGLKVFNLGASRPTDEIDSFVDVHNWAEALAVN